MPTLSLAQDAAADELLGRDPLALLIGMTVARAGSSSRGGVSGSRPWHRAIGPMSGR